MGNVEHGRWGVQRPHTPRWRPHGHPAVFATASVWHGRTGGRRCRAGGGCTPTPPDTPTLPVEPCAACAAGTRSRRLFWKTSRLFPSCLPPLRQLPGHTSSLSRDETGLSSTYFPAPHSPWCNFTPRCPHLHGASAAPKGWRGDGERGGCGWTDRFEFSFPALLISCHANPDTGKSLDHAERLRVCVCGCVLGEGANRQGFTRGTGEGKQADMLARGDCEGPHRAPCATWAAAVGASTSCRRVGGQSFMHTRVQRSHPCGYAHVCLQPGGEMLRLIWAAPGQVMDTVGRKVLSCPKTPPRAFRDGAKGTAWVSPWAVASRGRRQRVAHGVPSPAGTHGGRGKWWSQGRGPLG